MWHNIFPKIVMLMIILAPLASPKIAAQEASDTLSTDVIIVVDQMHPSTSDSNDGSTLAPLSTVQEAVSRARRNKQQGVSTTVRIEPGVYRETVSLAWTNRPENDPDNTTPIVVQGAGPDSVRITGSDVWSDWDYDEGEGIMSHPWQFKWGEFDPGWELPALSARREMIFVNGERMTQVDTPALEVNNTFFVDESGERILLRVGDEVRLADPVIEVSVRDVVWDQRFENNVRLSGIRFDHAATPWKGGQGGVRVTSSRNVEISDCVMENNNWVGLYVGQSEGILLESIRMNHNGGQGWNTWRVLDFASADTETSFNNWRGELGDFRGWSVGNKLESMHNVEIVRHRAVGNHSRGLWLDYDIQNAVLDSLFIFDNKRDGIWLEANPGPIEIRNSRIISNGESGIRSTFSQEVSLIGNTITNNAVRQIEIAGKDKRWVKDFVSNEREKLTVRDWKIYENSLSGGKHLIGVASNHKHSEWLEFLSTLEADDNTYSHKSIASFLVLEKTLSFIEARSLEDFEGWQEHSGQDLHSTFQHLEDN